MNTRSIQTAVVLAAAAVLVSVSIASAQPWRKHPGSVSGPRQERTDREQDRFDETIKQLGLTPEQRQKLDEQRKDEKAQAEQLRTKMQETHQALARELDKDQPDRKKVRALIRQMKAILGARLENKVDGILAMKTILTPEQLKKLNEKAKPSTRIQGGYHEKESHHRFDHRGFGRGNSCTGFCQRLG